MTRLMSFSLWAIFAIPGVIAALSLFGLIAALLGDGVWDWMGWLGLLAPVAATVWALAVGKHR
ncbi:hypothetical protein [Brevundimonas sp. Root1279]|uniref:hypothetical protein n=1 Tax=Brevundimonas sp. Root1279 TaxID=1736443 RepID=UPI0006FAD8CB|nr:hypothetical protein [Brevundimonas sp. Root1279]KQW86522.1 hypothetical protein ASC65_01090 [Brevundimonas sp. Root1279]